MFRPKLEQGFVPDIEILLKLSEKALLERSLVMPLGDVTLKKKKIHYELRWGDLKYAVTVQQTKAPTSVPLTYRKRDLLTQIMRVHRAEAGSVFKVIAVMLMVGHSLMVASGIYMGLKWINSDVPFYMR